MSTRTEMIRYRRRGVGILSALLLVATLGGQEASALTGTGCAEQSGFCDASNTCPEKPPRQGGRVRRGSRRRFLLRSLGGRRNLGGFEIDHRRGTLARARSFHRRVFIGHAYIVDDSIWALA